MNKSDNAYKTIGEVARILNLKSRSGQKTPTHTIRFWEKEFKQIKPKILTGNRRYYNKTDIDLLKKIKFLLKDQGMTINGVKRILNSNYLDIDDNTKKNINLLNIKYRLNKINYLLKNLKKS